MRKSGEGKLGLWPVVAISVGGMVGGGIFAVLGLAVELAILLFLVAVGLASIKTSHIAPASWSPPLQLAAGGMIIFVAYEGFELIANTAQDVRNAARTLPRAYYADEPPRLDLSRRRGHLCCGIRGAGVADGADRASQAVGAGGDGRAGGAGRRRLPAREAGDSVA